MPSRDFLSRASGSSEDRKRGTIAHFSKKAPRRVHSRALDEIGTPVSFPKLFLHQLPACDSYVLNRNRHVTYAVLNFNPTIQNTNPSKVRIESQLNNEHERVAGSIFCNSTFHESWAPYRDNNSATLPCPPIDASCLGVCP